jgi:hypothetical protein
VFPIWPRGLQNGVGVGTDEKDQLAIAYYQGTPFGKKTDAWEMTRRGEGIKTLIRGVDFAEDVELKS